jgi:hypothetical protein
MNTANLQLEGVYAVLAALVQTLRDKSILSDAEIGQMLAEVERNIASDGGRPVEVRASNVEAMRFPVRYLRHALEATAHGESPSFAQVVARIGRERGE